MLEQFRLFKYAVSNKYVGGSLGHLKELGQTQPYSRLSRVQIELVLDRFYIQTNSFRKKLHIDLPDIPN